MEERRALKQQGISEANDLKERLWEVWVTNYLFQNRHLFQKHSTSCFYTVTVPQYVHRKVVWDDPFISWHRSRVVTGWQISMKHPSKGSNCPVSSPRNTAAERCRRHTLKYVCTLGMITCIEQPPWRSMFSHIWYIFQLNGNDGLTNVNVTVLTCLLSNPRLVVWRCKKNFNYGGVTSSVYDGNNLYCVICLERRCNEIIIIIIIIRPSIAAVIYCGSHPLRRPSTAAAIHCGGYQLRWDGWSPIATVVIYCAGHLPQSSSTATVIYCDGHLFHLLRRSSYSTWRKSNRETYK